MKRKVSRSRIVVIASVVALLGIAITAGIPFSAASVPRPAHAQPPDPGPDCDECKILSSLDLGFERTTVLRKEKQLLVLTEPRIESSRDLTAYQRNSEQRMFSLSPSTNRDWKAVVTFAAPLTFHKVESLLDNVTIHRLRYISHPRGGGKVSYPLPRDRMQHLETAIAKDMRERKGIQDFRLVAGFVAAEVEGHAAALQALQNNAHVFLVDVGAVELLSQYPEASIEIDDIYYRYNKYSQ